MAAQVSQFPIVVTLLAASLCACASSAAIDSEAPEAKHAQQANDITPAQARSCVAQASEQPFPQFISPSGSQAFRRGVSAHLADLHCCVSETRKQQTNGDRVRINLVPVSQDPNDGAFAELDVPVSDAGPNEAACVDGVLETWHMEHAAVSDVIQLDEQGSARSRGASVSLVWAR